MLEVKFKQFITISKFNLIPENIQKGNNIMHGVIILLQSKCLSKNQNNNIKRHDKIVNE